MDTSTLRTLLAEDPAASQAAEALNAAGGDTYIVGGAVRDTVLGKLPKDIDLLVSGLTQGAIEKVLSSLPGHATFAGKNFGVYHYHVGNDTVEIAMPRTETPTGGGGHKDFDIRTDSNLSVEEDMARRDFTANAMAYDTKNDTIIDPFNGEEDIKNKTLRLISDQSFRDDPLRIVRALVSYSTHGLEPDEYTLDQMEENAARIRTLPTERIQMELDKLLSGTNPAGAFELAWETGILDYICPELSAAMGVSQHNIHHDLDVGDHTLAVLDYISKLTSDPDLRLAALLHDLGKPDTLWMDEQGNGHFYQNPDIPGSENHEDVGADIAYNFMTRLHYPNARIQKVVNLVQHHMFPYFNTEAGARKLLNKVNGDTDLAQGLMDLREADSHGKRDGGISDFDQNQIDLGRGLLQNVINKQQAITTKDLAINGHDLMQVGITPGPQMGVILNQLLQEVIENPEKNTRDGLLEEVKEKYGENSSDV
jgi:tRNA nucleotidyltransferase (CCA-adding enzyme)